MSITKLSYGQLPDAGRFGRFLIAIGAATYRVKRNELNNTTWYAYAYRLAHPATWVFLVIATIVIIVWYGLSGLAELRSVPLVWW